MLGGAIGTARLLDRIPGTIFTAGDNAYDRGSARDFADCYGPTWGRHKARTRPAPGNHDLYWHLPRFSSGPHGSDPTVRDFWRLLYDAGADIVINGHDHDYERFAPQDPSGKADPTRGIRRARGRDATFRTSLDLLTR